MWECYTVVTSGYVTAIGTSADELATGSINADFFKMKGGDDVVFGYQGDDIADLGSGNDLYHDADDCSGQDGDDRVYGRSGSDIIWTYDGNDLVAPGVGNDYANGGKGRDTVSYKDGSSAGYIVNLKQESAYTVTLSESDTIRHFENVIGSTGADIIIGTKGANDLNGFKGDDVIYAGKGKDTIDGGKGNDIAHGESGNDLFVASTGQDSFDGGAGTDTISFRGKFGPATVHLGLGTYQWGSEPVSTLNDVENIIGGKSADTLTGNALVNVIKGGKRDDLIDGAGGNDRLFGEEGDDWFIGGTNDSDEILGGKGTDTVDYSAEANALAISLSSASGYANGSMSVPRDRGTWTDSLRSIENAIGGAGHDVILGSNKDNRLEGLAGNDTIHGGGGDDELFGSDGEDILHPGTGNDHVDGGDLVDTVSYAALNDDLRISLRDGVAETVTVNTKLDTIVGVENAVGGSGDDNVIGDAGDNVLVGGAGSDRISGREGNDILEGGLGARDNFVYRETFGVDTVIDFEPGLDKINVIGMGFANKAAALATAVQNGSDVELYLDPSGSGHLVLENTLVSDLSAGDFLV